MPKSAEQKTEDLAQIYQQYAQYVYRYLVSLSGDEDLAEELTQETFAQAVGSIDRFDGSCKLTTWLCAIAKNQLMAWRRKHPPMVSLDAPPDEGGTDLQESGLAGTAQSPEEVFLAGQQKQALYKGLHDCPEPYREVLYLRLLGGLSFKEIGDVLGQSETWARVTFYRGKEKLKGKVRDDEE